jgi:carboxymethylenebutenolidase
MSEREIRVPTADGSMITFVVHPDEGGQFPVALLFMDGVGYREQIKENARRFAEAGFFVAAPDLFYRSGDRISFDFAKVAIPAPDSEERKRMMAVVGSLTPEMMLSDVKSVLTAIESEPAAAKGPRSAVGYCMGARVALGFAAAFPDEVTAAAGIHPGALVTDKPDSPHHDVSRVKGELYFAFAENDRTATAENVDEFRDELKRRHVRGEVERLPGTAHGFAMADLPVYDSAAAERHFEKTIELWRRNVQPA